jgi:hypothetical protein
MRLAYFTAAIVLIVGFAIGGAVADFVKRRF